MTYFHVDHQGTPIARSDAWGVVFERTRRGSFGLPLTGPLKNGPGYTGHMEDPGTGLVYMQQRYYDPAIGRFLSVDPVGPLADPINHFGRYHYGLNNPYRFTDADGRIPVETVWDAANVLMGAASFSANVAAGNYVGAAIDALGIVVDTAATATPYVPGGAGTAIKAARAADATVDTQKSARRAPTASQREAALQRSKGLDGKERCTYCGTELDRKSGNPNSVEIDHKQAYSKGGKTEDANLDAACRTCNRSKGARELGTEWVPPKDRR
jgi:RHS repeat-associated protein